MLFWEKAIHIPHIPIRKSGTLLLDAKQHRLLGLQPGCHGYDAGILVTIVFRQSVFGCFACRTLFIPQFEVPSLGQSLGSGFIDCVLMGTNFVNFEMFI